MYVVILEDLGERYIEAATEEQAAKSASWIWPNNKVLEVKELDD